jgi:hypothetical protein
MGVSRKNYYKNTLVYMAYESSYWNKSFSTQISLELLTLAIRGASLHGRHSIS